MNKALQITVHIGAIAIGYGVVCLLLDPHAHTGGVGPVGNSSAMVDAGHVAQVSVRPNDRNWRSNVKADDLFKSLHGWSDKDDKEKIALLTRFIEFYVLSPADGILILENLPRDIFYLVVTELVSNSFKESKYPLIVARLCISGVIQPDMPSEFLGMVFSAAISQSPNAFAAWIGLIDSQHWKDSLLAAKINVERLSPKNAQLISGQLLAKFDLGANDPALSNIHASIFSCLESTSVTSLAKKLDDLGANSSISSSCLKVLAERLIPLLSESELKTRLDSLGDTNWHSAVFASIASARPELLLSGNYVVAPPIRRLALLKLLNKDQTSAERVAAEFEQGVAEDGQNAAAFAKLIFHNSSRPETFLETPGAWSPIKSAVFEEWLRKDIVSASRYLSSLVSPPDQAIGQLISEIHDDIDAQLQWAKYIGDEDLKRQTLESLQH